MKRVLPYPFYRSLRFRFGGVFGLLFLVSLLLIAFFLYLRLKKDMVAAFDAGLHSQAAIIAQQTEVSPVVVPLSGQKGYYLITYNNGTKKDTLFNSLPASVAALTGQKKQVDGWREARVQRTLETGALLQVTYADRDTPLTDELNNLRLILFLYIPVALLLSIVAGYFLSGFLLRPINTIARRADEIRLHERITLLQEPRSRDELHYLTVVLNRMLERIGRQSDQQHAFFASASHELRTPLSVMLTGLESVLRSDLPPQPRELLQGQLEEVQRMSRLVNDFLLMSRLKSGELIPQKTPVNLAEVTLNCIQHMQRRSRQKQQTFRVNLRPVDAEFMALVDPAHLQVVVFNLVENAVKHGKEKDTIVVEMSRLPAGSAEGGVCFSISNLAEPPAGDIAEWKEEFRRQDTLKEGLGLGLFIIDQLVRKNNGRLTLDYAAPLFIARVALPAAI